MKLVKEVCRSCRNVNFNSEDDRFSDPYLPEVQALSDDEFNHRWDKRGTLLCLALCKFTMRTPPKSDDQEQPPWGYIRVTDDVPEGCPFVAEHAVAQEKP